MAGEAVLSTAEWFSASCSRALERERAAVGAAAFIPVFPNGASAALWLEFSGESEDALFDRLSCGLEFLEEAGQFPDQALAATDDLNLKRLGAIRHVLIELANLKSPCALIAPVDWRRDGSAGLACAARVAEELENRSLPCLLMGHLQSGHCSLRIMGTGWQAEAKNAVSGILKEFACEFSQEHGCGRIKRAQREALAAGAAII